MTDNEIIKALECCISLDGASCGDCPVEKGCISDDNVNILHKYALDLINRQDAENEHFREVTKKIKTDLKYYLDTNEENGVVWIPKFTVDNLVKELTEGSGNEKI